MCIAFDIIKYMILEINCYQLYVIAILSSVAIKWTHKILTFFLW